MGTIEPISMGQARANVMPEFYARYRALGGLLPKRSYDRVAAHLFYHTFDVFIFGDCTRHRSDQAAWSAFTAWLRKNYPGEKPSRIFRSIDDVHAYT